MHVAVLEDESHWIEEIRRAARNGSWSADFYRDSGELLIAIGQRRFDAVISDIHLGAGMTNGVEALRQCRQAGQKLPVLMLTQFSADFKASHALDAGADDYMLKPFDGEELSARLRALIRRDRPADASLLHIGPLRISRYHRSAHWHDVPLTLRGKGFEMLALLSEYRGDVVSREVLWNTVWEGSGLPVQERPIEAAMFRMRKDIGAVTTAPIVGTVSGRGYRLALDEW